MSRPLPDVPALPEHSTDSTGVLTGNHDLSGVPEWRPWPGPSERAPLPVYPQPIDLPPPPVNRGGQ